MKKIEVVAAVIHDGKRIFATQRGYGEFKGWWEFPGGKVEPGEGREQALTREIREELATHVAIEKPVASVEYDYPTFHLVMHCFLCTLDAGAPTLLEHSAARWLSREDIETVNWLPADIEVINALKQQRII